jgi:uncharacterized membrane protein YebE (DUF533 family)
MKTNPLSPGLRAALTGLLLALLTILYGQGMGIFFGVNEQGIKNRLKASAAAVRETVYKNDDAAIKVVLDNSWNYMKRAHLHAGGMGTTAFVLMLTVGLLGTARGLSVLLGLALGLGGLGYSVYWMWAGFRAPGLGATGAAKESLKWLAMPTSGAFVLATLVVLALVVSALRSSPAAPANDPT